jgi:putative flippase GtrA
VILNASFVKFLGVGAVAFVMHTALIYFLVQGLGLWEMLSFVLSFVLTMTMTWASNRWLTFQVQTDPTWHDYFRYVRGMLMGGLINMAVFTVIVNIMPPTAFRLLIGTAAGTLAGLIWNYGFMHKMWAKPLR